MLEEAENILDYRFRDESLLKEALTHSSSADHRLQSNERLEFLGDAILGFVVCEYLFQNFPDLLEGELTKIKSAVVSRKICARVSRQINLSPMLSLGKGMSGRSRLPGSIAAAVFEAIIAAIYLDGGIEPAREFILRHMAGYVREAAESAHHQNFKSVLQQYAQKHLPTNPVYVILKETGPDHSKRFEVCVEMDGRRFTPAWGESKKEAEQQAALHALCEMNVAAIEDDNHVVLIDPLENKNTTSLSNSSHDDLS